MSAAQAGLDSDQLECVFTRPALVRGIFPGKEVRQASQIDCLFNGTPVVALGRRAYRKMLDCKQRCVDWGVIA